MSDQSRLSTPLLSSSGGRLPPIARPAWPWVARSYSQRSQPASPHPAMQGSGLASSWDGRSSLSSSSGQIGYTGPHQLRNTSTPKPLWNSMNLSSVESTRQWTFTGFEWAVRDVHKLRDFVERINNVGESHGDFEVLKQSPMLGDGKFKLEIAPTVPADGTASNTTTLSLYITSLMVDCTPDEYEAFASMMAAVKCQDDLAGQRGARPEWVWEFWQNDWVFRRGSEVWECPLPTLSSLLENPRIRDTDSLVICIQIHCPVGPSIPQQPSVYYVPKDLLDGLEASLDNSNTGDVRFICLEKYTGQEENSNPNHHTHPPQMSSGSSGTSSLFSGYATARKRVIYAHSDILIRRSEYFATMLSSSFAENSAAVNGDRKVYTVIVEEADFETMYWLLKYCYANWLLFKQDDDPRLAVEGIGAGWSVKCLNEHRGEWEWKTFHKGGSGEDASDNKSAGSGESLPVSSSATSVKSETYHPNVSTNMVTVGSSKTTASKASVPPSASRQASTNSGRRTSAQNTSSPVALSIATGGTSIPRAKAVQNIAQPNTFPSSTHYPVSPRSNRATSVSDPHSHPTPPPPPASALAIYQTAHRYAMPHLAALALDHIMSTITPRSSFSLLLATSLWEELHNLVEDYVVERWDEVSVSVEFEQCCKEVAAGEWGPDGGKTLMSVFRRLRSPA